MAFRGWRLFGLAGTVFIYVAGILLLSIISLQNTSQRRPKMRSLIDRELMNLHRREVLFASVHNSLKWCAAPLTFMNGAPLVDRSSTGGGAKKPNQSAVQGQEENPQEPNNRTTSDKIHYSPLYSRTRRKLGLKTDSSKKYNEVRGLTGLVSFPGSGNTWLRYLLQQSTGKLTGSVYKDLGLMKSGFPAESICNSSVLVVKTHEWGELAFKMFGTAILLVRDPKSAIVAEFNRQSAGHVGFASVERFRRRYWRSFVMNKLWLWEQTNMAWANGFPGRLKILYYDDLISNLEDTLRDTLVFIGQRIDEEKLKCAIARKEGIYRRRKRFGAFDPYSKDLHELISAKTKEVYAKLGRL